MVIGGSEQEILDLGFVVLESRQQGVHVILRELMHPNGFDTVAASFKVRDVTTGLFEPRLTSCRTEMYLRLMDHEVRNSLDEVVTVEGY
ncbi:unnamed protein product [Schistosoma margrebowiei]|uniref:Uncharacterized protein n=1 Tax=Schistosoma margrebowiei TaxID=48269 RepID=A0A183M4G2_9TREM|nr:unnamed protein product [Schistosoma margrebowiei]